VNPVHEASPKSIEQASQPASGGLVLSTREYTHRNKQEGIASCDAKTVWVQIMAKLNHNLTIVRTKKKLKG
jgi:hypothetical protein